MKRILVISAAVIILLLIAGYGYLQYRKYNSFKVHIHKDASLLLKVNIDALLFEMGLKIKKDLKKTPRGFSLPANVFVYNVKGKSALTFFCTLPVTDTAELRQYLRTTLSVSELKATPTGDLTGNSKDGRLTVLYNDNSIVFAYKPFSSSPFSSSAASPSATSSFAGSSVAPPERKNVSDILNDILTGKNAIKDGDLQMEQLKNTDAPIAYHYENYNGAGSFKDNKLIISGSFPIAKLGVPDKSVTTTDYIKNPVAKIWLNADLKKMDFGKELQFKGLILERDSLLNSYAGYAVLELGNYTAQQNEEVSYEYNDDFEKVEVIKTKEVKVPEFNLVFSQEKLTLHRYLQQNMVIGSNNTVNKELFPLYGLYSRNDEGILQFSTSSSILKLPAKLNTPYFFYTNIDFNKVRKWNQFPLISNYIKPFNSLKITAEKRGTLTGQFELELILN